MQRQQNQQHQSKKQLFDVKFQDKRDNMSLAKQTLKEIQGRVVTQQRLEAHISKQKSYPKSNEKEILAIK